MEDKQQPTVSEPPFWYVVLIADELHLSHAEARERIKREMEHEQAKQQAIAEIVEVKP